jgi:hypothetical protein
MAELEGLWMLEAYARTDDQSIPCRTRHGPEKHPPKQGVEGPFPLSKPPEKLAEPSR